MKNLNILLLCLVASAMTVPSSLSAEQQMDCRDFRKLGKKASPTEGDYADLFGAAFEEITIKLIDEALDLNDNCLNERIESLKNPSFGEKLYRDLDGSNSNPLNDSRYRRYKKAKVLLGSIKAEKTKLAAESGDEFAQLNLINMYLEGNEVGKNLVYALEWATHFAEQGNYKAQFIVGNIYFHGEDPSDVPNSRDWFIGRNRAKALEWYRRSAENGFADAQFRVGDVYRHGYGTEQDFAEARKWYSLAAAQGYEGAQEALTALQTESPRKSFSEYAEEYMKGLNSVLAPPVPEFERYSKKDKTIIEQVLNYSTTGKIEGKENFFWEQKKQDQCTLISYGGPSAGKGMLAEVKKEIDIRLFNETVFRIKILPYNLEYNIHTYGDPDYSIKVAFRRLSDGPTIERLQKAWGLAFQECPGKTTPF